MTDEPQTQPQAAPHARRVVSLRHPGFVAKKPAAAAPPQPKVPAPAPAPVAVPAGSITEGSRLLVDTIVATFTDRLKSEAAKRGGQLSAADIDRLAGELDRKRAQLEAVFRSTFESYVRARERAAFDHARQFPFDRLIVNTFAELFTPQRADMDGLDRVTRKVLPGFFMALDRMVPPEKLEEFQERCRKVVSQISSGEERVMDWRALYDHPEAKELLIDALAAFAPYFEDLDKRRHWFLPLVNDNLQVDPDDDWSLTPEGFYTMALAMFMPLKRELEEAAGRLRMMNRHSAIDCIRLHRALDAMWRTAGRLDD